MTGPEDDEAGWDQDPVIRALRAPGTDVELSRQAEFVAAFRQAAGASPLPGSSRFVSRFGVAATAVVATVALTGGVAAAYTQSLPDPVQRIAHEVLGPVGVPAAPAKQPGPRPPADPGGTPVVSEPAPSAAPTSGKPLPVPPVATGAPVPTEGPSGLPTTEVVPGTPTGTPLTPDGPAPETGASPTPGTGPTGVPSPGPSVGEGRIPTSLSARASAREVVTGTAVTVSGTLRDQNGRPLRNRVVRLAGRVAGQPWERLAVARTDARGRVQVASPPLDRTTRLRLSTPQRLRSPVVRVRAVPVLDARATKAEGRTTVLVSALGADPGDRVVVLRRQQGRTVNVGAGVLDESGSATFDVGPSVPGSRLIVRLPGTPRHAAAQTGVRADQRAGSTSSPPRDATVVDRSAVTATARQEPITRVEGIGGCCSVD